MCSDWEGMFRSHPVIDAHYRETQFFDQCRKRPLVRLGLAEYPTTSMKVYEERTVRARGGLIVHSSNGRAVTSRNLYVCFLNLKRSQVREFKDSRSDALRNLVVNDFADFVWTTVVSERFGRR